MGSSGFRPGERGFRRAPHRLTEGAHALVTDNTFSIDVAAIRDRARQKMDRHPVTENNGTNHILDLLGSDAGSS